MATESIAGTAMWLDGIEILNDARTQAYLKNELGPPGLSVTGDCGCPNLIDIIGCDDSYIDPQTDAAPWYSGSYAESKDFLGFLVSDFKGLDSTLKRPITPSIGDGGILGRLRAQERTMTWRVYLIGRTCCATAYGLRWLTRQLAGPAACGTTCNTQVLDILVCCPESSANSDEPNPPAEETEFSGTVSGGYAGDGYAQDPYAGATGQAPFAVVQTDEVFPPPPSADDNAFRTLYGVGLVEGPTVTDQKRVNCGCGGAETMQVEFTIVAGRPYLYEAPITIIQDLHLSSGVFTNAFDPCPEDLFDCTVNPDCPPPATPPLPGLTDNCFSEIISGLVTRISVPRSYWPDMADVVPLITIYSGSQALGSTILDFYQSASGDPCGELIGFGDITCNPVCGTLKIPFIPAQSTLVIDGRTNRMSLICPNRLSIQPGEKLTSGEWGWPVFSCFGFCFEVTTENTVLNADATVSFELVPRSL